jgi:hypothetical protein
MAAVDSNVTPTNGRRTTEILETIAVTNAAASATRNRALEVPVWAKGFIFVLDLTITGTTPLFDLTISGGQVAGGRFGATLDSTTDKFEFTAGGPMTITQLTTDTSTPITTISCGPGVTTDTTGSATANSAYAFSAVGLPSWLIYTYTYDGTTNDEDYNGTISVIWIRR